MILKCPACKPIAIKVTRADGSKLGWQPESLYVGYLVTEPVIYKKPPGTCPNCQTPLSTLKVARPSGH